MRNIIIIFTLSFLVLACKKEEKKGKIVAGGSNTKRIKETISVNEKTTYAYSGNKLSEIARHDFNYAYSTWHKYMVEEIRYEGNNVVKTEFSIDEFNQQQIPVSKEVFEMYESKLVKVSRYEYNNLEWHFVGDENHIYLGDKLQRIDATNENVSFKIDFNYGFNNKLVGIKGQRKFQTNTEWQDYLNYTYHYSQNTIKELHIYSEGHPIYKIAYQFHGDKVNSQTFYAWDENINNWETEKIGENFYEYAGNNLVLENAGSSILQHVYEDGKGNFSELLYDFEKLLFQIPDVQKNAPETIIGITKLKPAFDFY